MQDLFSKSFSKYVVDGVGMVTREYDPGYGEPVWYIP